MNGMKEQDGTEERVTRTTTIVYKERVSEPMEERGKLRK